VSEEYDDGIAVERRLVNVISLLLPAKRFRLDCAWTQESALPALEEFSCRLLLLFGELLPSDLQSYFGLDVRERDVLVESLVSSRLANYSSEGMLVPSPLLQTKAATNPDALPTITSYEEREEAAVFEMLTLSILPRKSYDKSKYGLPEIPMPDDMRKLSGDRIIEEFSRQFRAHLEYSRKGESDIRKTRLYKVSACHQDMTLQVPIDMDVYFQLSDSGELKMIRDVSERVGEIRKRSLSNALESRIADYLSSLALPDGGASMGDFCDIFNDDVLRRYIKDGIFDFSAWYSDRRLKKTGYGTPETVAMIGPIFLERNRAQIEARLSALAKDWGEGEVKSAIWLASNVPLWAANGYLMSEFSRKAEIFLSEDRKSRGKLVALFTALDSDFGRLKQRYETKIPSGIGITCGGRLDGIEVFLIPGCLAVVQYHVQPDRDSSITVPIGYVTVEKTRIDAVTSFVKNRCGGAREAKILWGAPEGLGVLHDLGGLGLEPSEEADHAPNKRPPTVTVKPRRRF